MRRSFTPADDAFLIAGYRTRLIRDLAADLGRRPDTVQSRIDALIRQGRLDRTQRLHHRPWTPEDLDFLADHWGLRPDRWVAARLKRSVNACKIKATRELGIARKDNFWTARNVARLFGVDVHLVTRWIAAGMLAGRKSPVRCGNGQRMWRVDERGILAFIHRHTPHYDRRRIERETLFRLEAERVWQADPWLTADEAAAALGVQPETVRRHLRRGWLPGLKILEAGAHGGWRVRHADLAGFRPRQPTTGPHPNHWKRRRAS